MCFDFEIKLEGWSHESKGFSGLLRGSAQPLLWLRSFESAGTADKKLLGWGRERGPLYPGVLSHRDARFCLRWLGRLFD